MGLPALFILGVTYVRNGAAGVIAVVLFVFGMIWFLNTDFSREQNRPYYERQERLNRLAEECDKEVAAETGNTPNYQNADGTINGPVCTQFYELLGKN